MVNEIMWGQLTVLQSIYIWNQTWQYRCHHHTELAKAEGKSRQDKARTFQATKKRAASQNPLCHLQSEQLEQTVSLHRRNFPQVRTQRTSASYILVFHRTKSIYTVKKPKQTTHPSEKKTNKTTNKPKNKQKTPDQTKNNKQTKKHAKKPKQKNPPQQNPKQTNTNN